MDTRLKAKWVEALRSGAFEQYREGIGAGNRLCCLGVGARAAGVKKVGYGTPFLTAECPAVLGISDSAALTLSHMNDAERKSFAEIADYIEANL